MSDRELVVLGTASQVPTRTRNHNGYVVLWDTQAILVDPGEGTQRQLMLAGISASRLTRICLTHLHGDHALGLPGVLARRMLDSHDGEHEPRGIDVHFPAAGRPFVERLVTCMPGEGTLGARLHPVDRDGVVVDDPALRISARALEHRVPTVGWRFDEPDGRTLLPERLAAAGVRGPDVGRLLAAGWIEVDGRTVGVDELSVTRRGQAVAIVMDTGVCDAAVTLAEGADLLLCEATYLEDEAELARSAGHLTARQAATIAREAGVGRLVLTHLSSRYPQPDGHLREASEVFDDVVVAEDLQRVALPRRRRLDRP